MLVQFRRRARVSAHPVPLRCRYGALGTLGAIGAGAVNPIFALLLISVIRSYYLTDTAQLRRDVRTYSLAFVGVGVATILVYTCEHFFFGAMVSGSRAGRDRQGRGYVSTSLVVHIKPKRSSPTDFPVSCLCSSRIPGRRIVLIRHRLRDGACSSKRKAPQEPGMISVLRPNMSEALVTPTLRGQSALVKGGCRHAHSGLRHTCHPCWQVGGRAQSLHALPSGSL